jgi:hypothetical protein
VTCQIRPLDRCSERKTLGSCLFCQEQAASLTKGCIVWRDTCKVREGNVVLLSHPECHIPKAANTWGPACTHSLPAHCSGHPCTWLGASMCFHSQPLRASAWLPSPPLKEAASAAWCTHLVLCAHTFFLACPSGQTHVFSWSTPQGRWTFCL